MKKLSIFLSAIFSISLWFSFAANPSILNYSYTTDWDNIKIYWTDNSNWWNVDINVENPTTKDRMHFGTVETSDQVFTYTKQWDWDQHIRMIPDDWWDEVKFTIQLATTPNPNATRTVIPAVPKTGPDGHIVGIIIATIVIFGGYVYIRKRADI